METITLADLAREGCCALFAVKYLDRLAGDIEVPIYDEQVSAFEHIDAAVYDPASGWSLVTGRWSLTIQVPAGFTVEAPEGFKVEATDAGLKVSKEFNIAKQHPPGLSAALAKGWAMGDLLVPGLAFRKFISNVLAAKATATA